MSNFWIIGSVVMGSFLLLAGILTGVSRAIRYVFGSISAAWNLRPLTLNPPMSILKGLLLNGIVSGGVAWSIARSVAWNSMGMAVAIIGGMVLGGISGVIIEVRNQTIRENKDVERWIVSNEKFKRWTVSAELVEIFSGLLNGWLGGIVCGAAGDAWSEITFTSGARRLLFGDITSSGEMSRLLSAGVGLFVILILVLIFIINPIFFGCEAFLSWTVFRLLTPPLILRRFAAIVCQHCLRLTQPLQSGYAEGIRYCEHCTSPVELTKIAGTVRVIFGEFPEFSAAVPVVMPDDQKKSSAPPKRRPAKPFPRKSPLPLSPITMRSIRPPQQMSTQTATPQPLWFQTILRRLPERVFLLFNPDFDQPDLWNMEIEEVYIDPATCERYLLERFLTYILNYPPSKGLASVRVLHHGELQQLGENLKNAFANNFQRIEPLD